MTGKRWLELWSSLALVAALTGSVIGVRRFQQQQQRLATTINRFDKTEALRLLKDGASPNSTFEGQPALVLAVQLDGMSPIARELISHGAALEAKGSEGETALHAAATCGSIDDVKLLLAAGALVNTRDRYGNTPLHTSLTHTEVVRLLIQHGANVNGRNNQGFTPLTWARRAVLEPKYSDHLREVNQTIAVFKSNGGN